MTHVAQMLGDYTFQVVALGAVFLGIVSGMTGSFAVLRKQSLLGDSIAHASLAGIALVFMLTNSKETEMLLVGALAVGLLSTFVICFFARHSHVNYESALALVLSGFFGLGLIFLTEIQKAPNSNQAGLQRFLFGQAATILGRDVYLIVAVMLLILILFLVFWKELQVFSFDPTFAHTIGFTSLWLNTLLSASIVLSVIAGIQMVGVVLMSALLIAPGVAARQWTRSLKGMVLLASVMGGASGFIGTLISSSISRFPTGPAIVVVISLLVGVSLLFAPGRGLIHRRIRQFRTKQNFAADMMLIHFFTHHDTALHEVFTAEHFYRETKDEFHARSRMFQKRLRNLVRRKLVVAAGGGYRLGSAAAEHYFHRSSEKNFGRVPEKNHEPVAN